MLIESLTVLSVFKVDHCRAKLDQLAFIMHCKLFKYTKAQMFIRFKIHSTFICCIGAMSVNDG